MAVSIDLEAYDRRRTAMLALLKVASGVESFGTWMKHSDSIAARRTEKLESYLEVLYGLFGGHSAPGQRRSKDPQCGHTQGAGSPGEAGLLRMARVRRGVKWTNWWNWRGATSRSPLLSMHLRYNCGTGSDWRPV